jgi:hypothetical protein
MAKRIDFSRERTSRLVQCPDYPPGTMRKHEAFGYCATHYKARWRQATETPEQARATQKQLKALHDLYRHMCGLRVNAEIRNEIGSIVGKRWCTDSQFAKALFGGADRDPEPRPSDEGDSQRARDEIARLLDHVLGVAKNLLLAGAAN